MTELRRAVKNLPDASAVILLSIFPLAVLLKVFQYCFLPEKYFYDSVTILNLMQSSDLDFDLFGGSYNAAAYLFDKINLLGLSSLLEWSVVITFIGAFFLFAYFLKNKPVTLRDMIISLCIIGLVYIYVFNLSKDIIQFTIFALIYAIAVSRLNAKQKYALIFILLVLESIFYRSYYILTAFFMIAVIIFYPVFFESRSKRSRAGSLVIAFAVVFAAMCLFLAATKVLLPDEYSELINIRDHLTLNRIGSDSAKTLIVNLIPSDGSIPVYVINYFINGIRMMLPLELAFAGAYYYPFLIFQLICSYTFIKNVLSFRTLGSRKRITLYVMTAYYLVAFLFEPDFGSFVRHEAAAAPVLAFLLLDHSDTMTEKSRQTEDKKAVSN